MNRMSSIGVIVFSIITTAFGLWTLDHVTKPQVAPIPQELTV